MRVQKLTKFLSAKYLNISVQEFEKLVTAGVIKPIIEDKMGIKFAEEELDKLKGKNLGEMVRKGIEKQKEEERKKAPTMLISPPEELINKLLDSVRKIQLHGNYIRIRSKDIPRYTDTPLFAQNSQNAMVLYKPANTSISKERMANFQHPILYIEKKDYDTSTVELQNSYNQDLADNADHSNFDFVLTTLAELFDNAIQNPAKSVIHTLVESVDIFLNKGLGEVHDIEQIFHKKSEELSLSRQAVTNMTLAINFARRNEYRKGDIRDIALAALLHDIGIGQLKKGIESVDPKSHTQCGFDVLEECEFENEHIKLAALEHHERLDGSGFPEGKRRLSMFGQLIGIISEFDSLLIANRAKNLKPLQVLMFMKEDVKNGKFNPELFKQFAYSLV